MLNVAGPAYDFGNVLFAVLQECEHRRRSLFPDQAEAGLRAIAQEKLAEIHRSYRELYGADTYWRELEREVLETVLPQYAVRAVEQTRLECNAYDLWRQADPFARFVWGVGGLTLGGLIVWLPFIPIFEDSFAFALAAGSLFYPEIKRMVFEYRHARFLNQLVSQAEKYQKDNRTRYLSNEQLDEVFGPLEETAATPETAASPTAAAAQAETAVEPAVEPAAEPAAGPPATAPPARTPAPAPFDADARRRKVRERQGSGTHPSKR